MLNSGSNVRDWMLDAFVMKTWAWNTIIVTSRGVRYSRLDFTGRFSQFAAVEVFEIHREGKEGWWRESFLFLKTWACIRGVCRALLTKQASSYWGRDVIMTRGNRSNPTLLFPFRFWRTLLARTNENKAAFQFTLPGNKRQSEVMKAISGGAENRRVNNPSC